jgi:DNA polymerase III delta subunit
MYIYQFRNLLKVGDYYFSGLSDKYAIAKKTKLHPFVVQKNLAQLSQFSLNSLKNIYQKLEEIDYKVKNGEIEIELALDKFIMEL